MRAARLLERRVMPATRLDNPRHTVVVRMPRLTGPIVPYETHEAIRIQQKHHDAVGKVEIDIDILTQQNIELGRLG